MRFFIRIVSCLVVLSIVLLCMHGCVPRRAYKCIEDAEQLAIADWNSDEATFYYVWPGGNMENLADHHVIRYRDEFTGLALRRTKNERFAERYNSVIRHKIKELGNPTWASSFVVSNEMLLQALMEPEKQLNLKGKVLGKLEVTKTPDNAGFVVAYEGRPIYGVGENWHDYSYGYETWKSTDNPSIRFFRVGQWLGAFHEDGEVVAVLTR